MDEEQQTGLLVFIKKHKFGIAVIIIIFLLLIKTSQTVFTVIKYATLIVAVIVIGLIALDSYKTTKKQDLDKDILEVAKDCAEEHEKHTHQPLDYTQVEADEITPNSKKYAMYFATQQILMLYDALTRKRYGIQNMQLQEYQHLKEKNKIMSLMAESMRLEDKKKMELNKGIL